MGGPAPAKIMLLADASWPALYGSSLADGMFMLNQGLFTYNGNVARAYLDGHATSGKATELYWTAYDQRNGIFNWPTASPYWVEPWWDQKYWWLPYGRGPGPWAGK